MRWLEPQVRPNWVKRLCERERRIWHREWVFFISSILSFPIEHLFLLFFSDDFLLDYNWLAFIWLPFSCFPSPEQQFCCKEANRFQYGISTRRQVERGEEVPVRVKCAHLQPSRARMAVKVYGANGRLGQTCKNAQRKGARKRERERDKNWGRREWVADGLAAKPTWTATPNRVEEMARN